MSETAKEKRQREQQVFNPWVWKTNLHYFRNVYGYGVAYGYGYGDIGAENRMDKEGADNLGLLGLEKEFSFILIQCKAREELKTEANLIS